MAGADHMPFEAAHTPSPKPLHLTTSRVRPPLWILALAHRA